MKKAFGIKLNSQENINKAFNELNKLGSKLSWDESSYELEQKFNENLIKILDVCKKKGYEVHGDYIDCIDN